MKRINLGCGGNILEGWENHDADVDVTKPLPWFSDEVDYILAEHLTEHLSSGDAIRFLKECYRILKPGGVLRLLCPVLGTHLGRDKTFDLLVNHGHLIALNEDLMRVLLWCAGFNMLAIDKTPRREWDGHYKVIGLELDNLETCRLEAMK